MVIIFRCFYILCAMQILLIYFVLYHQFPLFTNDFLQLFFPICNKISCTCCVVSLAFKKKFPRFNLTLSVILFLAQHIRTKWKTATKSTKPHQIIMQLPCDLKWWFPTQSQSFLTRHHIVNPFKCPVKYHLPSDGIIMSSPFSPCQQGKG